MKQYRNSERTKRWIRKAFSELISEKGTIAKITVNELVEHADITKTTFYYHYDDLYAVAEEFENELIEKLNATLNEIIIENPTDYSNYIKKILLFIKTNEESYRLVVNASEIPFFASKLKSTFSKRMAGMTALWGFSQDGEKRTIQVNFLINACVDTMIQYLKGDLNSSIDLVGEVIIEAIDKLRK